MGGSSSEGGWGRVKGQRWDATPVAKRGVEEEEEEETAPLDAREWEEEQVKLDRDWYMTGEEGGVVRGSPKLQTSTHRTILSRPETRSIIPSHNTRIWMRSSRQKLLRSK